MIINLGFNPQAVCQQGQSGVVAVLLVMVLLLVLGNVGTLAGAPSSAIAMAQTGK